MAIVYQRSKGLTEAEQHFCPGCTHGVVHKLVEKSGSCYAYNGEKIGQGKDNSREYLKANPAIAEEIEAKIRAAVNVPPAKPVAAAAE